MALRQKVHASDGPSAKTPFADLAPRMQQPYYQIYLQPFRSETIKGGIVRAAVISLMVALSACTQGPGRSAGGIYSDLANNEDGIISAVIDLEPKESKKPKDTVASPNEQPPEQAAIGIYDRPGKPSQIGYVLVQASTHQTIREKNKNTSRIMASLVKVPTGLATLMNVPGVDVDKVADMLRQSDNLAASIFLRQFSQSFADINLPDLNLPTGIKRSPRSAHYCRTDDFRYALGAEQIMTWLKKVLSIDWREAQLVDGNGCNEANLMTPEQIVHILRYADSLGPRFAGQDFPSLLSANGGEGTLHSRLRRMQNQARVLAKTGTLKTAATLAGYLFVPTSGAREEKYYFAVMIELSPAGGVLQARRKTDALLNIWAQKLAEKD